MIGTQVSQAPHLTAINPDLLHVKSWCGYKSSFTDQVNNYRERRVGGARWMTPKSSSQEMAKVLREQGKRELKANLYFCVKSTPYPTRSLTCTSPVM